MLLGALFTTGALWATFAWLLGGWPETISAVLYTGTVVGAYIIGISTIWWGWTGRRLPRPLGGLIVATGSLAVMTITIGAGPAAAGVLGGFYTYVAAISFLWFTIPIAVAQLVFAGLTYAVALAVTGSPGPGATWIIAIGIALGGAGLVGLLGARLRNLYIVESRAADELREAERMKATFLQSVSHELRTPLTSVQGFVETLDERREELDEGSYDLLLQRLKAASDRLGRLLTDLLDVERLQRKDLSPDLEPIALEDLVARSLHDIEPGDRHVVVDVEPGTVVVEPTKVERVIWNLARNAAKHTPAGSRILVRARPEGAGGLVLEVADDGPGLDPDQQERLFHPFEQGAHAARAPSPGVGLGLALVDRFVALHNGQVEIGPGLDGAGVTFTVRIPPPADEVDDARPVDTPAGA